MTTRLSVRVTRRAAQQILAAGTWWLANRPAAPDAFRVDVQEAFELLAVQPRVGAATRNAKIRGVRRVHLTRIRYHVYYRVRGNAVEVLAFWHSSRGSAPRV